MRQRQPNRSPQEPPPASAVYQLRLFVAGDAPNGRLARDNLEKLCTTYLAGRHELVVHDVLQDFQAALEHRVLVTPTLLLLAPLPHVVLIGTLADTPKVLAALRLPGGRP
jgi:circadian clock protein KaiB